MASTTSAPAPKDVTFRSYTAEQAKFYATHRSSYEPALYDVILEYHSETGGQFGLLVDIGCGPGSATRDLAMCFDQAIGVDPGTAMIDIAREKGGKTKSGNDIRYEVFSAEAMSNVEGLGPNSVDLLTAATCAHWFEMDKFWVEAGKVVKPGGTVALWTRARAFVHPDTPNAAKMKEIGLRIEETLRPYTAEGNILARDMYDNLQLPWDAPTPVTAFPKSLYVKHEYDRDGILSNGVSCFGGWIEATLERGEYALSTTSQVTRWREAHPDLAGTDKDIVKVFTNEMRQALPVDQHQKKILYGSSQVIMLFKRCEELGVKDSKAE